MAIATLPSGIELCYESFGDPADPTVLLMHGLGSQLLLWEEDFCRLLVTEGFRVVRYDHRDSGLSTAMSLGASYDLSDMALDAVGLLDHLGVESCHAVGLSLGGMVAQTLAVEHRERCRTLVSMASTTGRRDIGRPTTAVLKALLSSPSADIDDAVEKDLRDRRMWASVWHDDDHARAVFGSYHARCRQSAAAYERQRLAVMLAGDREEALATITTPTLVLHGSKDTLITPEAGERTAKVIPGAFLRIVEGWGHDLAPGAWTELVGSIVSHCRAHP